MIGYEGSGKMAVSATAIPASNAAPLAIAPGEPHDLAMESRLAKLEGAIDGLKVVNP